MVILGIDPALAVSGYGVIDVSKGRMSLTEAGVIKTQAQDKTEIRLKEIYAAVFSLIKETNPAVVVLEKVFVHHSHTTTAFLLGQARGAISCACANASVPIVEYAATHVKKAIVGKGLASKYQVQQAVLKTLSINEVPAFSDVTDALGLALTHGYLIQRSL